MARTPQFRCSTPRRIAAVLLVASLAASCSGCINVFAMGAKILLGDPKVVSTFEQRTGVELQTGKYKTALVIDAPIAALRQFDALATDLQGEMGRRMQMRGIKVVNPDDVENALEDASGDFSASRIARTLDADYILHIAIEGYSQLEDGNPTLYRGRAKGMVTGYRVMGSLGSPDRHAVTAYQQTFLIEYPGMYPIPSDQVPIRVFQQRFIDQIAGDLGRQFYDVRSSETL